MLAVASRGGDGAGKRNAFLAADQTLDRQPCRRRLCRARLHPPQSGPVLFLHPAGLSECLFWATPTSTLLLHACQPSTSSPSILRPLAANPHVPASGVQAAQAEVAAAYAAIERRLALSSDSAAEGLADVRDAFAVATLPDLAAQLRALNAKVAALEGSTLSAGAGCRGRTPSPNPFPIPPPPPTRTLPPVLPYRLADTSLHES